MIQEVGQPIDSGDDPRIIGCNGSESWFSIRGQLGAPIRRNAELGVKTANTQLTTVDGVETANTQLAAEEGAGDVKTLTSNTRTHAAGDLRTLTGEMQIFVKTLLAKPLPWMWRFPTRSTRSKH